MALSLSPGIAEAIAAHGVETYPNECCGALIGHDGTVSDTLALPNMTDEGPRTRFRVTPNDYRAAERRAGELGAGLLGVYPSHPDHPAGPSPVDMGHAPIHRCRTVMSNNRATTSGRATATNGGRQCGLGPRINTRGGSLAAGATSGEAGTGRQATGANAAPPRHSLYA